MPTYNARLQDGFNMMDEDYERPLPTDQNLTLRDKRLYLVVEVEGEIHELAEFMAA